MLSNNICLQLLLTLNHWGRVMHLCISKQTIIGSDNGLSPGRRQAINWTNAGLLSFGPLETNFSEILIKNQGFSFTKNAFENAVYEMAAILSKGRWANHIGREHSAGSILLYQWWRHYDPRWTMHNYDLCTSNITHGAPRHIGHMEIQTITICNMISFCQYWNLYYSKGLRKLEQQECLRYEDTSPSHDYQYYWFILDPFHSKTKLHCVGV